MMEWAPPDDPDPSEILESARNDIHEASHAPALTKLLWFHHNALRYKSSLGGVRLSFALADWFRLAAVYPPAMAALTRTRDETESAFTADPSSFKAFLELSALNRQLGEGVRTADLFVAAARNNPTAAARLYHVAEPYLVAARRYDACGPYLDPPKRLALMIDSYGMLKSTEEEDPEGEVGPPKVARLFYERDVGSLVALLVLNNRAEEAKQVYDEALTVLDDEAFRTLLDAAMTGQLPPPLGV